MTRHSVFVVSSILVSTGELNSAKLASGRDGSNGGEQIQNAIDEAEYEQTHPTVAVIGDGPDANGQWVTDGLQIGDNTTQILIDAYIKLANGADTNIIRNKDLTNGNMGVNPVKLMCGQGHKLKDVYVDTVHYTGGNSVDEVITLNKGPDTNAPNADDFSDITISNIKTKSTECDLVRIQHPCSNVKITDIDERIDNTRDAIRLDGSARHIHIRGVDIINANRLVVVEDGATITGLDVSDCSIEGEGQKAGGLIACSSGDVINDANIADCQVRDAEYVFSNGGEMNGAIQDILMDNTDFGLFNVGPNGDVVPYGGIPPYDARSFAATQRAEYYNDGTTGTEGPAHSTGTGWTSTVDGTSI